MRRRAGPRASGAEAPDPASLRSTALRLLGRRDYTRAELETRLADRGFLESDIRSQADALEREGILNDRRAAEAHLRTASRVKNRGRARIRRELEARGIDASLADEVVGSMDQAEEREQLERLIGRQPERLLTTPEGRERLVQRLRRRGYSLPDILSVLSAFRRR